MKKKYVKPQIIIENFSLSTTIAGECEVRTWTPNSGECAYEWDTGFGVVNVFLEEVQACITKDSDRDYDGVCYHVPLGENLFNS